MVDFNYIRKELTMRFFNELDDMVSDYKFAFKAIENMGKSNLHKKDDEWWSLMSVNQVLKIMENSETILHQSRSRCSHDPSNYKCINKEGVLKGRCNTFKLTIPQILGIDERLRKGESELEVCEDYPISRTSFTETMKKYYCGLFNLAIEQYWRMQKWVIIRFTGN